MISCSSWSSSVFQCSAAGAQASAQEEFRISLTLRDAAAAFPAAASTSSKQNSCHRDKNTKTHRHTGMADHTCCCTEDSNTAQTQGARRPFLFSLHREEVSHGHTHTPTLCVHKHTTICGFFKHHHSSSVVSAPCLDPLTLTAPACLLVQVGVHCKHMHKAQALHRAQCPSGTAHLQFLL